MTQLGSTYILALHSVDCYPGKQIFCGTDKTLAAILSLTYYKKLISSSVLAAVKPPLCSLHLYLYIFTYIHLYKMSRVPISQSYASGDRYDQFYFYEDLAPSQKSYSEYYTGRQEIEPVFYEDKTPRNLSSSHYNATRQGHDQSSFYQDLNPSYSSYSEYSVYGQEVESVSCEATTSYTSSYSDYYAYG
ncbi:unnamed protein product [Fusarium graminearum]|uniref:Chromosome 4, complete genome n=2 Tax=Gibberella zeae TaxID=5518 RepID=A0A098DNL7_GIBZE|nr:unnamed protein product [Fusarium graminearum]